MLRIPIGSIQTPAYAGALAALKQLRQPNLISQKLLITRTLDLSVGFNQPALTPYPLFNISGTVAVAVAAQCTEDIVVGGLGVVVTVGVTSDLNALLGRGLSITVFGIVEGEWFTGLNAVVAQAGDYGPFPSEMSMLGFLVQEDEQIMWDITGCGTITDGTVVVYCWYLPLDEEGVSNVTLA